MKECTFLHKPLCFITYYYLRRILSQVFDNMSCFCSGFSLSSLVVVVYKRKMIYFIHQGNRKIWGIEQYSGGFTNEQDQQ